MRRVGAVIAAVGMIVAALVIRAQIDDDDDDGPSVGGPRHLVCATELAGMCEAFRTSDNDEVMVTEEAAGTTADRLVTLTEPDFDAWLVTAPWPTIVDEARQRRGLEPLFRDSVSLARSPLVVVAGRATLEPACAKTWRCLGEQQQLNIGIGNAAAGATSLLVVGHAVASYVGRTSVSTADLENPDFDTWFRKLASAVPQTAATDPDLVTTMITQLGTYTLVGTSEAAANNVLRQAANRAQFTLTYPEPVATADLVLATVTRRIDPDVMREAVRRTCWRAPDSKSTCAGGTVPLPATNGLPSAGLLDSLRARWREATGS